MNFPKGSVDGQVNKMIDQAAGLAKDKINEALGGQKKGTQPAGAKAGAGAGAGLGGIGDMVTGAITKAAVNKAKDNAAEQVLKKFME